MNSSVQTKRRSAIVGLLCATVLAIAGIFAIIKQANVNGYVPLGIGLFAMLVFVYILIIERDVRYGKKSVIASPKAHANMAELSTNHEESVIVQLDAVYKGLKLAKEHNLESEVMLYAIKYAKKNPDATVAECIEEGIAEWDI